MKNPIRSLAESQMSSFDGYKIKINYPVFFLRAIVMPPFIIIQRTLEILTNLNESIGDKVGGILGAAATYEKINK
jgi:hypothetical protein